MSTDLFQYAEERRQHGTSHAAFPPGIPEEVCKLFERFALEVRARGFARYSADALLHRIRWHQHIEVGDRLFKCNDHWTAPLARWFLRKHPDMAGFFELRERRQEEMN